MEMKETGGLRAIYLDEALEIAIKTKEIETETEKELILQALQNPFSIIDCEEFFLYKDMHYHSVFGDQQ
jgi:hypothetical protein